jgi:hypothetical protein
MDPKPFLSLVCLALASLALAGCSKVDVDEKPAEATARTDAAAKPGVTLDAERQERLGLKVESPAPARWQPGIRATGRVANPLAFIVAAAEYETARTAAAASQSELIRTQKLAAQENASPRTLEAAQAAAARDSLAFQAARAKFTTDWGPRLAGQTNLMLWADQLFAGSLSLVKLDLPAGVFPEPLPARATIYPFGDATNAIAADLADNLNVNPNTQVQTLLFSLKRKLPPEISVTARLQTPGEAVSGWLVPDGAILRYEGRGWVYLQTDTNQFARAEVPLDRPLKGGWFVAENLSATNRIVVVGAQSVLSAELSSGGFTTGERD